MVPNKNDWQADSQPCSHLCPILGASPWSETSTQFTTQASPVHGCGLGCTREGEKVCVCVCVCLRACVHTPVYFQFDRPVLIYTLTPVSLIPHVWH